MNEPYPQFDVQPRAGLDERAARELRQKMWLLLVAFLVIHFLMLTARASVVDIAHQIEIARARLFLVPIGGVMCYMIAALLSALGSASFIRQTLVGALLSAVAAVIHATIWAIFLNTLDGMSYPSPADYVAYQSFYWYLFYFAWTTAYLGLSYSITVREQARHSAALVAEAQEAQIRALRYQINPHFLFNTLNSIAELVGEDPHAAEDMVVNLSEFFRATLETEPSEDVRLADEVALQELYLRIERVRFPDRLHFSIDLPPELADARVPSLIVQPLVENAVKHGVARSDLPTKIVIAATRKDDRLLIEVSNNGARATKSREKSGTGVGLANVRSRLQARYGSKQSLEVSPGSKGGYSVKLSLPLS